MKKVMIACMCLLLISACKSPYSDPAYKHETKKVNTPYTDWKKDQASAEKRAKKELEFYAKDECRRMAYGWYLKEVLDPGEMNCEQTDEGYHCRHKDMTLKCEQLDER